MDPTGCQAQGFFYTWLKEITNSQIIFQTASQSTFISITFPCAHVHIVGLLLLSHRRITGSNGDSGFCRTVPKTMTKTKAIAEVKGRQVFGVPLLVSVQQTGEPLPPCILRALVYLRAECLDQVNAEDEFRSPVNSFNKALSYIVLAKTSSIIFPLLGQNKEWRTGPNPMVGTANLKAQIIKLSLAEATHQHKQLVWKQFNSNYN